MAHYLVEVAYTPSAWAGLIRNPQDRMQALKPVMDRLGGTIDSAFFTFGDYDLVVLLQMPGHVDAAAFAMAATAGGAVKAFKTTPLMTVEEGLEAMRKAAGSGYAPPKG